MATIDSYYLTFKMQLISANAKPDLLLANHIKNSNAILQLSPHAMLFKHGRVANILTYQQKLANTLRLHYISLPIVFSVSNINKLWHTQNIYTLCALLYFKLNFTLSDLESD